MFAGKISNHSNLRLTLEFISWGGTAVICVLAATSPWATLTKAQPINYPVPFVVAGFLVLALIAHSIMYRRLQFDLPVLTMAVFCGVVGLSYLWTREPAVWRTYLAWWLVCFVCFWATVIFIDGQRHIRFFACACVAGAASTSWLLSKEHWQISGTAWGVAEHNPNLTAYCLTALAFVIVMVIRFVRTSTTEKVIFSATIIMIALDLVLLQSRAAQVSLFGLIAAGLVVDWLPARLQWLAIGVLVGIVTIVSSGAMLGLFGQLDLLTKGHLFTASARQVLWSEAYGQIANHPWFGIGPGAFPAVSSMSMEVHNVFLSILVAFGIFGFVIFVGLIGAVSWTLFRAGGAPKVLFVLAAFILPIATTGYGDVLPMLWVSVAFTIGLVKTAQVNGKDSQINGKQ